MDNKPLPYHLVAQNKLRGRFLGDGSPGSAAPLVVCILVTVLAGVMTYQLTEEPVVTFLVLLVLGTTAASLIYVPRNGWGPGYWQIHLARKSRRLERRQGIWWTAKPSDTTKPKHKERRMRRAIPIRIEIIEIDYEGKRYRIPLHHHIDKPYDQLYILAKGGAFASVDSFQKYWMNAELARIFDRTLSMTELRAGIACLRVTGPLNQYATFAPYMLRNMNPLVVYPEEFRLDDELRQVVERLRTLANQLIPAMQQGHATEDWGLFVVTIQRRSGWKKAAKGKATNEQLYDLPVVQLGRNLEEDLRASTSLNLHDVHIVSPQELFMLDRMSWDTQGIEGFYEKYAAITAEYNHKTLVDEQVTEEIKFENEKQMFEKLTAELSCWPEQIIVSPSKDCVRMDDNWISIVRVGSLPEQVTEDLYQNLNYIAVKHGVWMRHYIGGESISGNTETVSLMLKESAFTNIYDALFQHSLVKHPAAKRQKEKLATQSEIISANAIAQLFNEYWVIVAPNYGLLKQQRKSLCADLKARKFNDVQVVDVMALQIDAFLTGALGAARL